MPLSTEEKKFVACGRCLLTFPHVAIVRCGKVLVLCRTCHRRIHPRCVKAIPVDTSVVRICQYCSLLPAVISCPICGDKNDQQIYLLCQGCSDLLHHGGTSTHLDHVLHIAPKQSVHRFSRSTF